MSSQRPRFDPPPQARGSGPAREGARPSGARRPLGWASSPRAHAPNPFPSHWVGKLKPPAHFRPCYGAPSPESPSVRGLALQALSDTGSGLLCSLCDCLGGSRDRLRRALGRASFVFLSGCRRLFPGTATCSRFQSLSRRAFSSRRSQLPGRRGFLPRLAALGLCQFAFSFGHASAIPAPGTTKRRSNGFLANCSSGGLPRSRRARLLPLGARTL